MLRFKEWRATNSPLGRTASFDGSFLERSAWSLASGRQNSSPPNLSGCPQFHPGPPKHAPRLPLRPASFSTANQAQPSPRRLQLGSPFEPAPGSHPLPRHTPRPGSPGGPPPPPDIRRRGVGAEVGSVAVERGRPGGLRPHGLQGLGVGVGGAGAGLQLLLAS